MRQQPSGVMNSGLDSKEVDEPEQAIETSLLVCLFKQSCSVTHSEYLLSQE
jgi:hypothetical protein